MDGTTRQYIHADSIYGENYHGLLSLTEMTPTLFLPVYNLPVPFSKKSFDTDTNGQILSLDIRRHLHRTTYNIMNPKTSQYLVPLCVEKLPPGTLVLFRADMVHAGPEAKEGDFRTNLFFTVDKRGYDPMPDDIQAHPAYVAKHLFGDGSENYFRAIWAQRNEPVEPPLPTHINDEELKAKYAIWVSKREQGPRRNRQ